MAVHVLAYHHGHRIPDAWLDDPDRPARLRRLLTEQVLPADLS